jgi:hypothetical protein
MPLGDNEGISDEQRLAAYLRAKANVLSVPDIAAHVYISVTKKQLKASWKKGWSDRQVQPLRKRLRADAVFHQRNHTGLDDQAEDFL